MNKAFKSFRKVCVVGYPLAHSISPKLHGYWLRKYLVNNASYGLEEIHPDNFDTEFKELFFKKDYIGCNVTIPYKELVIPFLNELTPEARAIGAVNTVLCDNGHLIGTNTDSYGFIANLRQSGVNFLLKRAMVLGAGGAARAVIYGLLREGVKEIILLNRTIAKASHLQQDMKGNIEVYPWDERNNLLDGIDILVNTTSLGMQGQEELDISLDKLPQLATVTDIVYKPLQTKLLKSAMDRGNKVVDGIGMLLHQGVGGFEMWYGLKPEVDDKLKKVMLQ